MEKDKREDMVIIMSKKYFECEGKSITIDNQLLFQRLLAIAGRDQVELESALNFELNTQLAALFDKDSLMKTANKPSLADAIWKMTRKQIPAMPTDNMLYVFDGGDIFNRLSWKKGETYEHIYQRSVNKVTGNYVQNIENIENVGNCIRRLSY